jgi:hypothetical protein
MADTEKLNYAENYLTNKVYIYDGLDRIQVIPKPDDLIQDYYSQRMKNCIERNIHEVLAAKPERPNRYFRCNCGKYGFIVTDAS